MAARQLHGACGVVWFCEEELFIFLFGCYISGVMRRLRVKDKVGDGGGAGDIGRLMREVGEGRGW